MSLLNKIEKIQNKPKSYRKKVLVILMVLFMSAVILAWVSTASIFAEPERVNERKSGTEYVPFTVLKEGAANIKNIFNKTLEKIKN